MNEPQFWTDEPHAIGEEGFLVETSHTLKGWTRYDLRDRPAHTNLPADSTPSRSVTSRAPRRLSPALE
ncbi:MAG: hypothetical protein IT186_09090 [Acidobacteria bacterium]|nr:hypothetical protein [Acidobacteriota bacterium]